MKERLRHHARLIRGNVTTDGGFQVALESMVGGVGRLDESAQIEYKSGVPFTPGDVLFGKLRPYLAKVWLADRAGVAIGDIHVYRPREGVFPAFLKYVILDSEFIRRVDATAYGAKMPRADWEAIREIEVHFPPLDQQRAIADFLDRETAQIDAMIEAQQVLVSHLQQRRERTISEAVSFGLDGAPLVSSGIPWLGDCPAHWEVLPFKQVGRATIGLTYAPEDIVDDPADGSLVLRAGNIQAGRLDFEDSLYVSTSVPPSKRCRESDLLICSRNGSARLIGKSALIDGPAVGQTWGAFMTVFRSPVNDYLYWIMNSSLFTRQLGLFATSTINQLTTGMLHNMRFALPPRAEQIRIMERITSDVGQVDRVLHEATRTVDLLRKRREALITAAVTGRIDPTTGIERVEEAS